MKYSACATVPVRVRVKEIEADSQMEVVRKITEEDEFLRLFKDALERSGFQPHFNVDYTEVADDEPIPCILVDEIGDEDFTNSNWYIPSPADNGNNDYIPMPWPDAKTNPNAGNHADHGSHALESYLSVADATGDMETDLIDLLTALRYLAKREEIDMESVIRASEFHFEAELEAA